MQYAFYLLGPFAFLGSADFRGWWIVAVLRAAVRLLFIFGLAFVCTWVLAKGGGFGPPGPTDIARQVCLVMSQDRGTCPDAAEGAPAYVTEWSHGLEEKGLYHADVARQLIEIDDSINARLARYEVQVFDGAEWVPMTGAYTGEDYRLIAQLEGRRPVPIFTVERALVDIPLPGDLIPDDALHTLWTETLGLPWPFRAIRFESSPYVLSTLVLSAADPDLSTRDGDRAREIMDSYLDSVPAAASSGFVWPRRLNGPVQYACYLLFFAGLIYIGLHWIVNILPNRLLRASTTFTVRSDRFPEQLPAAPSVVAAPVSDADDTVAGDQEALPPAGAALDAPVDVSVEDPVDDDRDTPVKVTVEVPWSRNSTDLDITIREMEAIRDVVRHRAGFLGAGAVPSFPKLDVWIAGLLAMKSSRSGENVPSFVSTEIEAAAERLEAHQRLLAFIVWAIPTLGFIGTVIGIGTALLATVDLQSGESITRLQAESRVAVEIGVAFDTTLIALALSFILMLALHLLQHLEESMLSEEKHDTLRALLQIENILPDDPLKELRDGLAQLGLAAAQIERWTDVLDGRAPRVRAALDELDHEFRERQREQNRYGRRSNFGLLAVAAVVSIAMLIVLSFDPTFFGLLDR